MTGSNAFLHRKTETIHPHPVRRDSAPTSVRRESRVPFHAFGSFGAVIPTSPIKARSRARAA